MFKKTLLLLLLLTLFTPWMVKAQETLTVNTVVGEYEKVNYLPIYTRDFFLYTRTQTVFPASDLTAMEGGYITEIKFYTTRTYGEEVKVNVSLYLTEIQNTTISEFVPVTDGAIVYTGHLHYVLDENNSNQAVVNIIFSRPYFYSGGNLVFECRNLEKTWDGTGYYFDYKGIKKTDGVSRFWNSETPYTPAEEHSSDFLPKTTFTYTSATCPIPTGLTASLIATDDTKVTLSWTENGSATSWMLQTATNKDFTENLRTYHEAWNPCSTIDELTPKTTYYARVKSFCGSSDESIWSTTCEFTTSTFTVLDGSATNNCVPIYGIYVDDKSMSQFIIPASDLTDFKWVNIDKLKFYAYNDDVDWTGAQFEVYITEVDYSSFSDNKLFNWLSMDKVMNEDHLEIINNSMEIVLDNPYQYLGGNLMIGIKQTVSASVTRNIGWYGIEEATWGGSLGGYENSISAEFFRPKTTITFIPGVEPSCYKPTKLTIDEVTNHTATISWTKGSVDQDKWQVYYSTSSTAPADNINLDQVINVETTPTYTCTGLNSSTQYYFWVRSDCDGGDYSKWTGYIPFTTEIACAAPSGLTYTNLKSDYVDLSWTNGGSENWVVAYKAAGAADFTEKNINLSDVTQEAGVITYTLGGLTPETHYTVKVCDNCEASCPGDGMSEWTSTIEFDTYEACPQPTNVTVSDITHHNAQVNWTGLSDSYIVKYRKAAGIAPILTEDFEFESHYNNNWTVVNFSTKNTNYIGRQDDEDHDGIYSFRFSSTIKYDVSYDEYLINKNELTGITENGVIEFYYMRTLAYYTESFKVGYSSTDSELSSFTYGDDHVATQEWQLFHEAVPAGTKYISIFYTTGEAHGFLYIDDIVIGNNAPAGDWQTVSPNPTTTETYLTGLDAGTKYDVSVAPYCDETLMSMADFTTEAGNMKYFIIEGEWGTASNWMDSEIPSLDDNVTVRAHVTIAENYVAYANNMSRQNGAKITIKDGGELYHSNTVYATMEKNITGASTWGVSSAAVDGWYLISNPLNSSTVRPTYAYCVNLAPAAVGDEKQFDLYRYSESGKEWENYYAHTSDFYLTQGMGFLYSRKESAIVKFLDSNHRLPVADVTPSLTYTEANGVMAGWNLLGNPFSHSITWDNIEATNVNATGYYKLGFDGAWTSDPSTTAAIKPMEGFLVKANAENPTVTIKNVASASKDRANDDFLAFTIANSKYSDVTYAMFSDGESLEKINHRNADVPMVYIPQDGQNCAIATMGDDIEVFALNFKAMTIGKYSLSVKMKGHFSYLHLIDKLTGEDVDMLLEEKYEFVGLPRDNEARFIVKLSYNASGVEFDEFAYQNGDEIIVNGEGILQVYDVMGRFVSSYNVNGNMRINASQFSNAVYILKLIGNDVKTQKIVVRGF